MRVILQRVSRASVRVENKIVGAIEETGYLALVGITHEDGEAQLAKMADKTANLRLFDGEKSALEVDAPVLAVSQFTLYGDVRKGRRPSWSKAAPGPVAEPLVDAVVEELRNRGIHVETGRFGAMMSVELVNDGPYTLVIEV